MSRLRVNVAANYAGHSWVALMGVVFVPTYLAWLGADSFGLIAFMLSLQAISLVLDLGANAFIGREVAKRAHRTGQSGSIRQLLRSFETLVWPVAFGLCIALYAGSDAIALHWLNPDTISREDTSNAVKLIALAVAAVWPTSFYSAALSGLEEQKRLNATVAVFATLRFAGALPFIHFTGTGLLGFLGWHAFIALSQSLFTGWLLWSVAPPADGPVRFSLADIRSAKTFALGVFAASSLGLLWSQLDRLTLSALRPLDDLGYYAVAVTISAGLGRLVQPMFNATYPRFVRLMTEETGAGNEARTAMLYHLSSQIVAVLVASMASIICVFPETVLLLWTGNAEVSSVMATPLVLLFAGAAINGIMNIPFALQLASGWTRLAAVSNLSVLLLAIPAYLLAIGHSGLFGASLVWFGINVCCLLFMPPLMHRRLLRGEATGWYLRDILPPFVAAFVITLIARSLLPELERDVTALCLLLFVGTLALCSAMASASGVRTLIRQMLARR